jgi:hypothetical protein
MADCAFHFIRTVGRDPNALARLAASSLSNRDFSSNAIVRETLALVSD